MKFPGPTGRRLVVIRTPWLVLISLAVWLMAPLLSGAQNTIGLPLIVNYGKTDFHGGAQTWDIKQDKRGLLYFANNEGLLTYDGTYWKIYPLPNRTILRSIAIDKNDRIYVGGQGEIGTFSPDGNGFLHYESLTGLLPQSHKEFADIWNIEIFSESVFFRATDRIFELKNNAIRVFTPKSQWQFMSLAGGELMAQDRKNGLLTYRNNEWIPLKNNSCLGNELVSGIVSMGSDGMLVSTIRRKFYGIKNDSLSPVIPHSDIESGNTDIYKAGKLNSNEFVAGTTSEGCLIMDFSGRVIQRISRTEGLQNNSVLCVFLDRENNLWAGLNNGISLIAYNSAIKYIRPNKSNELSGFSSRIFNNSLYIGTSDGAYTVPLSHETRDLSFSKGEFSPIRNSSGQVWRIDEVNQQLLMGHNGGTYSIDHQEATSISPEASWLFVPTSAVMPSPHVLAGTYTGLRLLSFQNNKFTNQGNLEGIYESFRFLAIDNNNTIWASHPYRGIYKLAISADETKYDAKLYTDKDGLPSSLNNQVFRVKNRIVFATEKGAYEFDPASNRFVPSSFLSPVFGTMELRYLNEDDEGNIWFCSGKAMGVVHYNEGAAGSAGAASGSTGASAGAASPGSSSAGPASPKFTLTWFPELKGQILSGFENVYPYNSENIFIASEKGIIHLNYKKYISTQRTLSVVIGNVRLVQHSDSSLFGGYAPGGAGNGMSGASQAGPAGGGAGAEINAPFPNSYNSFHFEFSSPAYSLQSNIEYSYKLEGYDKTWSSWSSKTEKDYTNLPEGKYSFMVKAHDNLDDESKAAVYSFSIDPPFYKTVWAYLGYALLFGCLIYLLNRWQDRNLNRQRIKYEERQAQIIALHNLEIEKSEKEIIKLQNEKLANEVLLKKKELANASMHLVEREDALARVKEELQTLYKKTGHNHDVKTALQLVNELEKNKSNWDQFASHFNEINNDFLKKLKAKFPTLTNSDLKVCAYLQLNLSTKEIAQLMNISVRGVDISRYRLRKKFQLSREQTLNDFLNSVV
ncbi:MAG TPA: triple tyrosine motif-containing protein [Puia sp.]|nr:triple tyrosine motif-containing protein [Puia sp.]